MRRFSGGRLQRAAPDVIALDGKGDAGFDAALRSPDSVGSSGSGCASASDEAEAAAERAQEMWVESIRVVEALRGYILGRLESGAYEDDSDDGDDGGDDGMGKVGGGGDEMDGVEREVEMRRASEALYPTLVVA